MDNGNGTAGHEDAQADRHSGNGHFIGPYPADTLRRLQLCELDILKTIDRICRAEGLTYFLESGTCIGAMRHDGFLPWDDDMDIGMPLSDYLRFCEIAPEKLPDGLALHTQESVPGHAALFAKVCDERTLFLSRQAYDAGAKTGIYVDVFPFCRLSDDPSLADRQRASASRWQKVSYLYHSAHPKIPEDVKLRSLKAAACVVAHGIIRTFMDPKRIKKHFEEVFVPDGASVETADPGPGRRAQGSWCSACYSDFGALPGESLFPTSEHIFEDGTYPVPHDADVYLTIFYGDWRQLPKPEARHGAGALVLDFGDGINAMETCQPR